MCTVKVACAGGIRRCHTIVLEITFMSILGREEQRLCWRGAASYRPWGERPADVLLCRPRDIRVGQLHGGSAQRVALDIGIVCSQAASHVFSAAIEVCGAAEEYVRTKCRHADIERR